MSNFSIIPDLINLAIEIQQIPAPTFSEHKRAEFIYERMKAEGLQDVSKDQVGNVYGRLEGKGKKKPFIFSAHLDTVFPAQTNLSVHREADRVYGPGIGDNSLGVAGLVGLLWSLKQEKLSLERDIWLVANVGEEGLGDLCGMKAVVARFGDKPIAYIILEGMAFGTIYHRGLSVRRFKIETHTEGGHSWVNFGRPSAIHELARFISLLEKLPIKDKPRTSFNVGMIQGGTSINTIANHASLELDLRSENRQVVDDLARQIEELVSSLEETGTNRVEFSINEIGNRPGGALPLSHPLLMAAQSALESQGLTPHLDIGSTDANIPLSMGYPAVCIGLTRGTGAHTPDEWIEVEPISKGLSQIVDIILNMDQQN